MDEQNSTGELRLRAAAELPISEYVAEAGTSGKVTVVRIEYLNSQFVVFDANVARHLLKDCRIVVEPCGTVSEARADFGRYGAPYVFMPEQTITEPSFGFATVVRLKDDPEIATEIEPSSAAEPRKINPEPPMDIVELRKKAEMIAKGRKAKKLKRQADSEATASAMKVRRCDIDAVEVTASEIDEVLEEELSKAANKSEKHEIWLIPLCDAREEAYEKMERPPFPETSFFRIRLNTFRDLWRRGYYLTCGLKFGCDYLAYEAIPGKEHSKWLVKCVDSQDALQPLDLIALSRLSSQVKKYVLLAIVSPDSLSPYYIEYSWWKPQRSQSF